MPLFRFSARIKAFKVTTCNGATCEKGSSSTAKRLRLRRITKHSKIRRSPPERVRIFAFRNFPNIGNQTVRSSHSRPKSRKTASTVSHPGVNPCCGITHLAASETIVPFAVDAHRSESGAQRSAEYLHQAAFSTAIASQQCRCSAGFDGKIYTRKNHPITERQLDRIYFKNMFFRGVHTVQGIRISAAYNTPASLCRNSHPTAYVVEPPDCGNSRTHRYNAV